MCVLALLLPLAAWDSLGAVHWTPKAALLLLVVVPGVVALGNLVVRRDRGAWAATAFLLVAALSTALSSNPVLSLLGDYNWGTGWLFLVAVIGLWAIGRHMSAAGRGILTQALVAAVLLSAALAVVEGYVRDLPAALAPFPASPQGLTGNSAFLGALMAMGMCLVVPRVGPRVINWPWLAAVALVAAAVQLSAARISVALALLVVVVGIRRASWAVRLAVVAAVAVGVIVTSFAPNVSQSGTQKIISTGTSGAVTTSDSTRLGTWQLGLVALPHHAVIGTGTARFGEASLPHMTLVQARRLHVTYYSDAHNFVLQYATTTGLVGLAALVVFLGLAALRARGYLARTALVAGVVCLVEPQNVVIVPLALLALGASDPPSELTTAEASPFRVWRGVAAGLGVLLAGAAGGMFLYGDLLVARAGVSADPVTAANATGWLPSWPDPAVVAAKAAAFHAVADPDPAPFRTLAISWARAAVDDDRALPSSWSLLGDYLTRWRSPAAGEVAFRQALARNPWDLESLVGLASAEDALGQTSALRVTCLRLSRLVAPKAPPARCR